MAIGANNRTPIVHPTHADAILLRARRCQNGSRIRLDPDRNRSVRAFDVEVLFLLLAGKVHRFDDRSVDIDIQDVGLAVRKEDRQQAKAGNGQSQDSQVKRQVEPMFSKEAPASLEPSLVIW